MIASQGILCYNCRMISISKFAASSAVMTVGALARSRYERKHFETRTYTVEFSGLPQAFDGFGIVFLTDLHNNSFGQNNELLLRAIDGLHPDIVAIGGDMMVAKGQRSLEVPLHLAKALSEKYPVYYGLGNHEHRMDQERRVYGEQYDLYMDQIERMGIPILRNRSEYVERKGRRIRITGLDLSRKYYKKVGKRPMDQAYLRRTLGEGRGPEFHILLAHSPLYFKEYVRWGADLVLAGHFHGGTICLPGLGGVMTPNYMFFPAYDRGLYSEGESRMVLSAGLGTHSVNIRLNNRPQLILIKLRRKVSANVF